jgi:hypothetical protein
MEMIGLGTIPEGIATHDEINFVQREILFR